MSAGADGQKTVIAGRYQLEAELGGGAFGRVYHASDLKFHPPRQVAIKLLREQFTSDPVIREQFVQEASNLAAFNHPNILTVYDFGLDADAAYIVTPLADHGSLADMIRKQGRLSLEETGRYLEQIADAIEYAHSRRGVIHRDLKPQNILLDESGRLLVADLGLARIVEGSSSAMLSDVSSGTPSYMAPEQWQGQVGRSNDIYALGIILFEMLTGTRPFKGNQFELMGQHLHSTPPSVKTLVPELPAVLDDVIRQALAKDPRARPRHATELVGLYRKAIQSTDNLQIPPASPTSGKGEADEALTTPLPPVVGTAVTVPAESLDSPRPNIPPTQKKNAAPDALATSVATPPHIIPPGAASGPPEAPFTMLATPDSTASRRHSLPKGRNLYILIGGLVLLIVALLAGFILLTNGGSSSTSSNNSNSSIPQVTPAAAIHKGRGEIRNLAFGTSNNNFYSIAITSNLTLETTNNPPDEGGPTVLPISKSSLPHVLALVSLTTGRLMAVGDGESIKLLSTETNKEVTPALTGHKSNVTALAFSKEGETLISVDSKGIVKFWDVDRRVEREPEQNLIPGFAWVIAISPDGKTLMVGDGNGQVVFYDLQNKKELFTFKTAHSKAVTGVAFSPTDNGTAISVSEDQTIKIWDVKAGKLKSNIDAKSAVYSLVMGEDGKSFATGGEDGIIRLWNLSDQQNTYELVGHSDKVLTLALSPDGKTLVSGSADGSIKIWK